jgi:hypothetical protein
VVAKPIRLDDQSQLWPEKVDFEVIDALFAQRYRQLGRPDDAAEVDLQVRVGELEEELVGKVAQRAHSRLAAEAIEPFAQRLRVDEIALIGVIDRSLEWDGIEFGCQIKQRLDWRGNGNVVSKDDVLR